MRMARIESAIRLVLEYREAFNRHDLDGLLQLMSEDCILEPNGPSPDGLHCNGKEAVANFWREHFHNLPSARLEVEEIYGLGNRCVLRWKCLWTDTEGRTKHLRGVDLFRVRDGHIYEQLSYVKK